MRILLADYSGHAFPAELSRELARRGHRLLHLSFAEFQSPKGRLQHMPGDVENLEFTAISLGKPFAKHDLVRRRGQEIEVGRQFAAEAAKFRAGVVIACNMPLDTIRVLQREAINAGRCFVFWQQDVYSIAIGRILARKLGPIGRLIGRFYHGMEGRVLRASDAVVTISRDFLSYLHDDFGVDADKIHVVENWAPLDEITPRSKDNPWAKAHGLNGQAVILYTGTLGMKHDPGLIVQVAEDLRDRPNTQVVVTSEGPAAEWLRQQASKRELKNLTVLGFQPFSDYPDVLASADVVLAILEGDSGAFCVPSKILSYLCAGRPVAMSGPLENLSVHILESSGGGVAVTPGNGAGLAAAVKGFLDDPERCKKAGQAGRAYAVSSFQIADKADRFEFILESCARRSRKG